MTNNSVSRRLVLQQMSVGAPRSNALQVLDGRRSRRQLRTRRRPRGLGGYSTGELGPALRETKLCRLAVVVTAVAKG